VPGGDRIQVDTSDSMVTLRGTVRSQTAKQSAVAVASQTNGVRRVEDPLKVQLTP